MNKWQNLLEEIARVKLVNVQGQIDQITGLVMESTGPKASIGEICFVEALNDEKPIQAEVVGFRDKKLLLMQHTKNQWDVNPIFAEPNCVDTAH